MWTIWRERNQRTFEGLERSSIELKLFLLRSLNDWTVASSGSAFSSLEDFLDFCTFS
jgi:hypothetical protein